MLERYEIARRVSEDKYNADMFWPHMLFGTTRRMMKNPVRAVIELAMLSGAMTLGAGAVNSYANYGNHEIKFLRDHYDPGTLGQISRFFDQGRQWVAENAVPKEVWDGYHAIGDFMDGMEFMLCRGLPLILSVPVVGSIYTTYKAKLAKRERDNHDFNEACEILGKLEEGQSKGYGGIIISEEEIELQPRSTEIQTE